MTRQWLTAVAAVSIPAIGLGAQQPVFRSSTAVVIVDVSVRRGGKPVQGLLARDFQLTDNGVPQQFTLLPADRRLPMDLAIVVDVSRSAARDGLLETTKTAIDEVRRWLLPEDRLEFYQFGTRMQEVANAESLHVPPDRDGQRTALWEAAAIALLQPVESHRRRFVVLLTDGFDTHSFLFHPTLRAVARKTEAILHVAAFPDSWAPHTYGVIATGAIGAENAFRTYAWPIADAATATGGALHVFRDGEDFLPPIKAALDEARARYLLEYTPNGVETGGWHTIRVSVTQPGTFDIVSRQGYEGSPSRR